MPYSNIDKFNSLKYDIKTKNGGYVGGKRSRESFQKYRESY